MYKPVLVGLQDSGGEKVVGGEEAPMSVLIVKS